MDIEAAAAAYDRKVIVPDENSATRWWPRLNGVEGLAHYLPRTEVVPFDLHGLTPTVDGKRTAEFDRVRAEVWAAAQRIGRPCFVRTDLASAKHSGPEAYRLEKEEDLGRVLFTTFEDNWGMKDLEPVAFLVREWLDLNAPADEEDRPFIAFRGHLIAPEWRFFASRAGVLCKHFYWPEEALWREPRNVPVIRRLQRTVMEQQGCPKELDQVAYLAANAQASDEVWSIDVAQVVGDRWYLIDMALARCSWHPKDCVARAVLAAREKANSHEGGNG